MASLINDTDPRTAADAPNGLARSLVGAAPDRSIVDVVTQLASEDRDIGLHIAAGLQGDEALAPELASVVETLKGHVSVRVRRIAGALTVGMPGD